MANLEVMFHVPEYIERGLLSGAFERVGGVIVETGSQQVVAWLRDSLSLGNTVDVGGSIASNMLASSQILDLARIATTLTGGQKTRDALALLHQSTKALQQTAENLSLLTRFTVTGQMVKLSLAAASFPAIIRRLDRLEEGISELKEIVRAEFDRDRDNRFKTALQAARDVFESQNPESSKNAARYAIDGLFSTREHLLTDFHSILSKEPTHERLLIAQHLLIEALYAEISRIRCYLHLDDSDLAKRRLVEGFPIFQQCAHSLIKMWLGEHPAIFLHRDVELNDVDRFLYIQRWLRVPDASTTTDAMAAILEIIDDLRHDFWNMDVVDDEYSGDPIRIITRRPVKTRSERLLELPNRLDQIEIIIENYQRLLGFELELRSMRLSFDHWSRLVSEDDIRKHGIGIIVATDILNNLEIALEE